MNIDEYDYSSQDRKILTWNKENYEEFVQSFTKEELKDMLWFITSNLSFPIDYCSDDVVEKHPDWIVHDYIHRWLYTQLEEGIITGTRQLFEIVMMQM